MHNKQSIGIDIRTKEGYEIFSKLVEQSDAVIDNFGGTIPEKLKITYEHLKKYNDKIVCTHLSGYGRTNERADWPGYDFLMQAETGWMSLTGEPGSYAYFLAPQFFFSCMEQIDYSMPHTLGEDTDSILANLDYSSDDIVEFRNLGVVV